MKTLFRLFTYAPPLTPITIRYLVLVLFGVLFSIINFSLLLPVLDLLFNTGNADAVTALPAFSFSIDYAKNAFYYYCHRLQVLHGPMGALQFTCIVILVSVTLANIFKYAAQRTITRMQSLLIRNLRQAMFEKLMTLHVGFFRTTKKGHLLSVSSNDINEIQSVAGSALQVLFREPLFIIAYAAVLFYQSPQLTLFTLMVLPVAGLLIAGITNLLRRNAKQSQVLLSNLLGLMEEAVSGIRIIKIFTAERFINRKFDEFNNAQRLVFKKMWNRIDIASPLSEVLGIAAVAFIVLYGGHLIFSNAENALTGSEFIVYIVIFSQILTPAKSLAQATANFQRGLASAERVFTIFDTDTAIKERPDAVTITAFERSIDLHHVSFAYNTDLVLKDINLHIEKGKTVALVGQSGSGKTTLVNLIPRLYDVTAGAVTVDGVDVRDCRLHSLYNQISMVAQEQILFNDTVYNNIVFGMTGVTEADVVNAAKIANAHEFIIDMENGYQTNIGDQGNRLSGGQRQRLSIARAILKNPPILILDEATSALDTESERLVQDALARLMQNRTSIVIAHRLSTIQHADMIVVLQKGTVAEQGTHAELIARQGIYKRLCDMQTFD
ncbi:MAG: ATP-binding cassette domain-containing protein [Prevotellaceae bacterium]|jgi:subfamily B ATP-binding cassette protein MsbA|nr:ATP-binding cassette domain-containing protein [Prevotellaceae bacterium]